MEKKTLALIGIIIIICIFLYLNNDLNLENFQNNQNNQINYNKYPETIIEKQDGLNKANLYSNYEGELKNKEVWENKTLAQCQKDCGDLGDSCIGFTRDNIDDDMEGSCYPRTNLSICHSIRKGNAQQKENASKYNTFIKSNKVSNQKTKCLGADNLTLNRLVYINSYSKPDYYICNDNNSVKLKKYEFNGSQFKKQCEFKIVEGLAGEGTVSIQIMDNYDEKYYISDDGSGRVSLIPIRTGQDNRSTLTNRNRASFELIDGLADIHNISFKTYSLTGNNKYLMMYNETSDSPRLKFVSLSQAKAKPKLSTFDIVDNITKTSIITSNNVLNIASNKNIKNRDSIKKQQNNNKKGMSEKFQSSIYSRVTNLQPAIEVQLDDGTKLPIFDSTSDIGEVLAKYRIEDKGLNPLELSNEKRNKLKTGKILKVFVNKPNSIVGLYSETNYRSHANDTASDNYIRELESNNNNNKKMLYSTFNNNEKPNIAMQYGDLFDFNFGRMSRVTLVTTNPERNNSANPIKIEDDEKRLTNSNHKLIEPRTNTESLNIKSIKIIDNVVNELKSNKHSPKINIYNQLRAINDEIENNYSESSNIDQHIDKLKNKHNEYKNIRQILTTELFEKQKKLGNIINSTKSNKTALELKNIASDYFFVKGLGNDAGLDMEI